MTNNLILIADTDPDALIALSKELRGADYDVVDASSGAEALELCEDLSPGLVLVDMQLPGLEESGVVQQLHERFRIPMIFLSEQSDLEVVQRAIGQGAFCYLVKPLDPRQVVPVIESALRRSGELSSLKKTEKDLTESLMSSRQTNVAFGLLMERFGLSQIEAQKMLTDGAAERGQSVKTYAAELIRHANALSFQPVIEVQKPLALPPVVPAPNSLNPVADVGPLGYPKAVRNPGKPRDKNIRYLRRSMRNPKEK